MVHKIDRNALLVHKSQFSKTIRDESSYARGTEEEVDNTVAGDPSNIVIIENFVSEDTLAKYDNLMQELQWKRGVFSSDALIEHLSGDFMDFTRDAVKRALDIASVKYGIPLCVYGNSDMHDSFGSFNRWDSGDYLKLHADSQNNSCSSALNGYIRHSLPPLFIMYSALIYINDNYEGGELRFHLQDIEIKPKRGTLIMFPGSCMYLHEVKQIRSGSRYTHNFFMSNSNLTSMYLDMVKMLAAQDGANALVTKRRT